MKMPDVHITQAEEDDLATILALQYLAYQSEAKLFGSQDIPPLKQTLSEVRSEYRIGVILKAVDADGKIVGSVRGWCENGTVHIGKLIVHPDFQRKGIGTNLLLKMESVFPYKRYELFTSTRSAGNIKLYRSLGYEIFREEAASEELTFVYLEKQMKNSFRSV